MLAPRRTVSQLLTPQNSKLKNFVTCRCTCSRNTSYVVKRSAILLQAPRLQLSDLVDGSSPATSILFHIGPHSLKEEGARYPQSLVVIRLIVVGALSSVGDKHWNGSIFVRHSIALFIQLYQGFLVTCLSALRTESWLEKRLPFFGCKELDQFPFIILQWYSFPQPLIVHGDGANQPLHGDAEGLKRAPRLFHCNCLVHRKMNETDKSGQTMGQREKGGYRRGASPPFDRSGAIFSRLTACVSSLSTLARRENAPAISSGKGSFA